MVRGYNSCARKRFRDLSNKVSRMNSGVLPDQKDSREVRVRFSGRCQIGDGRMVNEFTPLGPNNFLKKRIR